MSAVKIFLLILILLVVVVFAGKNMDTVELSYYDFSLNSHELKLPLLVVIICSGALGFIMAWVSGFIERLKLNSKIRSLEKANQGLADDLKKLDENRRNGRILRQRLFHVSLGEGNARLAQIFAIGPQHNDLAGR